MRLASDRLTPMFALAACLAIAGCGAGNGAAEPATGPQAPPEVPAALAPPDAKATVALRAQATGTQGYACAASGGGFAWSFTGPEATLRDERGAPLGTHFAVPPSPAPHWRHPDGSEVVGAKIAAATPDAAAVPWLLLKVTSSAGAGALSAVKYIQRVHTTGGLAPDAAGCDAASAGKAARVPYTAEYVFYAAPGG
jgi:hypothetical protein